MPTQLLTIAKNTFVEAIRQPFYLFILLICGVLQVFNTWGTGFAMGYGTTAEVSSDNKLLLDIGLATVFVCGMLLAGFVATAVVSREIENKTVLTVISKPVHRITVIVGKYLGVSLAIVLAVVVMMIFLLLALRHGVLSTAADRPDWPVIIFATLALFATLGIAAWTNFFYGWSFPQIASILLVPAFILAYVGVLLVDKEWRLQNLWEAGYYYDDRVHTLGQYQSDKANGILEKFQGNIEQFTRYPTFRPQIAVACASLAMAIMVLTSVATAVSTRLGQVMTILVCAGVFVFGLLSDHLLGQRAFDNELIAFVKTATSTNPRDDSFSRLASEYQVELDAPASIPFEPGDLFYYGRGASGAMLSLRTGPIPGDLDPLEDLNRGPGRIVVLEVDGELLTLRHAGEHPATIFKPPQAGDAIFRGPTEINAVARVAWGVVPNMQFFWLVDAVSQNHPVPASHLAMLAGYSGLQIMAFLAIGVALFQTRDVG